GHQARAPGPDVRVHVHDEAGWPRLRAVHLAPHDREPRRQDHGGERARERRPLPHPAPAVRPGELALTHAAGDTPVRTRPATATVSRIDFGGVRLLADDGRDFEATVPGRLRGARKALGNAVVTGDRVRLSWDAERAVVEHVEPRRNAFSRRATG